MQLIILSNRKGVYLDGAVASIIKHVKGFDRLTIVDDSGDVHWRSSLEYLGEELIPVADGPAGYTTAMRKVFEVAEGEHVAFWEEDFRAIDTVDLTAMADLLDERPYLAEVVALRGPWFANEREAGGVLEALPDERFELIDGLIEHRAFWSTNPCVIPRRTLEHEYPNVSWSEWHFGQELLRDPNVRFGMVPGVRVEHVGERDGYGY